MWDRKRIRMHERDRNNGWCAKYRKVIDGIIYHITIGVDGRIDLSAIESNVAQFQFGTEEPKFISSNLRTMNYHHDGMEEIHLVLPLLSDDLKGIISRDRDLVQGHVNDLRAYVH